MGAIGMPSGKLAWRGALFDACFAVAVPSFAVWALATWLGHEALGKPFGYAWVGASCLHRAVETLWPERKARPVPSGAPGPAA